MAVTEPVIMEVVAGARNHRRETDLRRLLERFRLLGFDPVTISRRSKDLSPLPGCGHYPARPGRLHDRRVARRRGATLLAHDADIDRVAGVSAVALDDASLRA